MNILICFALLLLCLNACSEVEERTTIVTLNGTKRMVERLDSISKDRSNINTWHLNKERAQYYEAQLIKTNDPSQYLVLSVKCALEWLNAGDYNLSIARLEKVNAYLDEKKINIPPKAKYTIQELLGIAYLRKGEIENCLQNHNAYSCIMPIEKAGQHSIKAGSLKAAEIFEKMLRSGNNSDQIKWLYNLSQMTLGNYPHGIDRNYLIPPSVFNSEISFPRFDEIASGLGIGVNDISGSVVLEDFNNDDVLDLMVSSYGLDDQLRYFQSDAKGKFEDLTLASGIEGLLSGLNLVQADYDNDGFVDVLVLRGAWLGEEGKHPNSLLRNLGNGTFMDVTEEAGLLTFFPTQTASWADFNNDGYIDLFIGNEYSKNTNAKAQLFQNNGDGTFKNVASEKGLDLSSFIKGCVWGDFNNDNYMDLYVSVINGPNYLMKNNGPSSDFTFTNKAKEANVAEPIKSFPCWFFDYNQDGWEDIFVSGFDFQQFETAAGEVAKNYLGKETQAELPIIYTNNGDGTFTNSNDALGFNHVLYTMGCNYGDLNNDGFPDFYAATGTPDFRALIPNKMFLNKDGEALLDVTKAGGFGHLQKGHGVAFGDIDNDGDQDVYTVLGGSYNGDNFMNALFENPGFDSNWVKLKLVGTKSNRSAIGAKVKIIVSDAEGNNKTYYNRINSGGSFGANTLRLEQGIGHHDVIKSIVITWPTGGEDQVFYDVPINSLIEIIEGNETFKIKPIKSFKLKQEMMHHHSH